MAGLPEELRGPGLLLRRYRAGDAALVHEAALESADEVSPYETWCHEGYTLEEAAEYVGWWDQDWDKGGAYYYAVTDEATGRYLGSCGLFPVERVHGTGGVGFSFGGRELNSSRVRTTCWFSSRVSPSRLTSTSTPMVLTFSRVPV